MIENRKVGFADALAQLPTADGKRFIRLFERGDLEIEIYAPKGVDLQQPHTRDEISIVASGSGEFINGETRHPFSSGDFLFVPARTEHRFVNFTVDLAVWVIFFGQEG